MTGARWLVLVLALACAALAVWRLELGRAGLSITALDAGGTPATVWQLPAHDPAPVIVIAHGFAGSRQLMEGFAQVLARAGYIAVTYDLQGHGRNPAPMSGDVNAISGTTTVLMDELGRVSDAALALPGADGRLALVGHSMASDIVIRQAIRDPRVQAVAAMSLFSLAVTADQPRNLLTIAGAWEAALGAEALRTLRLSDPDAQFGDTVGDPATGLARRAMLAPYAEHVGVIFSPVTLAATRDWMDASFARTPSDTTPLRRGGWIVLLLASVIALGWPLAGALRRWRAAAPPPQASSRRFLAATLIPAIATPLILAPLHINFLPVLVADYLAVHFLLYGALALLVLAQGGLVRLRLTGVLLAVPVAVLTIGLFGTAADHYATAFSPGPARLPIIAAIMVGTVPFMLADAVLTSGGRAPLWRTLTTRTAALGSLGLAVLLNPGALFFLLIILPIVLAWFLLFGLIAGWIGRATWHPTAAGIGLGLFLGWALGVTFPMFAA